MFSVVIALVSAFSFLNAALLVDAALYVVKPSAKSTCHAGQNCTIEWLDDGSRPLVFTMGVCTMGLYHGRQKLVQSISPVDVSRTHSVTFVPNAAAGPISDTYYISIISTKAKDNKDLFVATFSPFFRIDKMTGSFEKPLPEATSTQPIPLSLQEPPGATVLSTVTVGTLSRSLTPLGESTTKAFVPSSKVDLQSSSTPVAVGRTTSGTVSPSSTTRPSNDALGQAPVPAFSVFLLLLFLGLT